MQKVDTKHSFAKLRQEALLTFNQAWSQPGGRPCEGQLSTALMSDLTGSKRAAQPADSDGLLRMLWDWTKACWGPGLPSKPGISQYLINQLQDNEQTASHKSQATCMACTS